MTADHDFNQMLGAAIRDERIAADVTQESLAAAVGMSRTSIVNIESGRQGMSLFRLVDIAYALEIPVTALLPDSGADTAATGRITKEDLKQRIHELESQIRRAKKVLDGSA